MFFSRQSVLCEYTETCKLAGMEGAKSNHADRTEHGEEALVRAWAAVGALKNTLTTQEGEQLRVVSPGVRNGGPGPDFLRAVLRSERGRLVRGDVELHRATSAWKLHGHGRDPGYDRVVLHVVGQDDEGLPTQLSSGTRVPVLVLSGPVLEQGRDPSLSCCPKSGEMKAGSGLAGVLEAQGWLRFQARVRLWARRLDRGQPDQLLYQAVMEGLGYQRNRAPFLRLALALSWETLQGALASCPLASPGPALLLGSAGYLEPASGGPLPFTEGDTETLRIRWQALGRRALLGIGDWRTAGVRPGAQPWVRLAGAGALLARWGRRGPVASLTDLPLGKGIGHLRRAFAVPAAEAGLSLRGSLIGAGRADVLALNVALPFLGAWWQRARDTRRWQEVADLYRSYTALEADNVVRRMTDALGLQGQRLRGCQQQGLHHLYRRYCLRARHAVCPVGQLTAGALAEAEAGEDV